MMLVCEGEPKMEPGCRAIPYPGIGWSGGHESRTYDLLELVDDVGDQ